MIKGANFKLAEDDQMIIKDMLRQMSSVEFKEIIEYLKKLERGFICEEELGICFNLKMLWAKNNASYYISPYQLVNYFSVGWEHHSGIDNYPVGDINVNEKWEGQSGVLRGELIQHIIKRLIKYIKGTHAK